MTENLLRHEASPYLLQHQDNPVHWRPWGPDALDEATRDNKPILLSIGYAACHWCHVMAHESFQDDATAALMNDLFVNIKVDREERPEIDQIYMAALHELGEQGGWPLTMFLTPDGSPIWGGTYFPPTPRYGRPGFADVLREVSRLFHEEPEKIEHNRALLRERLAAPPPSGQIVLDATLLDEAARRLLGLIDRERGGVRGAPKFPQTSLLEFLWRSGERTGDPAFREAGLTTLRNIAQGGITDHLGGGFARYSVDARWLAPHFEKMLYDNAQLIELMTYAFIATGEPLFRHRVEEAVGWLEREMVQSGGAFAASIDADSEGHEGKFYVWTYDEILEALGPEEGTFFATVYDVTPEGNWEGVSILNRLNHMQALPQEEETRLEHDRTILLERRAARPRPATDDKILADWNGLTIAALALAGITFHRHDWIDLGANAFRFITEKMTRDGRLAHSSRAGKAVFPGLATDYAAMIKAALALHQATLNAGWIETAETLSATLRRHHWDESNPGYFLPADDAEALIIRPRSTTDEATPSANSLMTQNLIRLWHLTGNDAYRDDADAILLASGVAVAQNLFAGVGMLSALDLRLRATDILVVIPAGVSGEDFIGIVRQHTTHNTILSLHTDAAKLPAGHPAAGKTTVDGRVAAYVCRGEACSLPAITPDDLAVLLAPQPAPPASAPEPPNVTNRS